MKETNILSKNSTCIGGTFDYIHAGHKLLTSCAVFLGKNIIIGITSDEMLQKKQNKEIIQSIDKRIQELQHFLDIYKSDDQQYIIEPLVDPVGPSGVGHLDCLVVSRETMSGGDYVNKVRKERGLNEAEVIVTDLISIQQEGINEQDILNKISSSQIRNFIQNSINQEFQNLKNFWNQTFEIQSKEIQIWFWQIVIYYSENQRFYHTLQHIQNLFNEYLSIQDQIKDKKVVFTTIWFHDIIYNPRRHDNEERSAELFKLFYEQTINENQINQQQYQLIYDYIIATKNHTKIQSDDKDLNLFLDLDLSILGQDQTTYMKYANDILLEYQHFPKIDLYKGRSSVLKNFYEEKQLFKSLYFQEKYEKIAKENLKMEIEYLDQLAANEQENLNKKQ